MIVPVFALATAAAAALTTPTGRGFGAPPPAPKESKAPVAAVGASPEFLAWAEENKIRELPQGGLKIQAFDGERGVGATGNVEAGATVLSVPSRLAIQTNTLSKAPRWCDENAWKQSKWDARLAMLLLHEKNDKRSELKPWLDQLPKGLTTPLTSPALLNGVAALDYSVLGKAVAAQRAEWDKSRGRAPGRPSEEEWDWAMSIVRSRAFSGPYTGGTFIGALAKLFLASTACLGYAAWVGGAGAADQAFDALSFVLVFILSNELFFAPRFSTSKRYVMCPWIDFFNHDGALGGSQVPLPHPLHTAPLSSLFCARPKRPILTPRVSTVLAVQVAYEYFSDAFAARLDASAGPYKSGDQLFISYGDRTNDVLLQYYGTTRASLVEQQEASTC